MTELFWSDVCENLGLSKSITKDINRNFGSILGITEANRIPAGSLGAISMIVTMQEQGFSKEEIEKTLIDSKKESGWPDMVLSRIQEQAASTKIAKTRDETVCLAPDSPQGLSFSWLGCLESVVSESKSLVSVQDMVLDLRREICTNTVSEMEQIHRLALVVERLIAEVRDLRYALVMAASRKDRKKGLKGLSRLLDH